MQTSAIILDGPGKLAIRKTALTAMESADLLVEIQYSGISAGTEKLLWKGTMPSFPGMGYPLVPGYESVGIIVDAGDQNQDRIGEWVFVPGANCYTDARGLFGGSARNVIVNSARALPISGQLREEAILYALAATALHAINGGSAPDLIVGHGVLGRLLARLTVASGLPAPTVWDINRARHKGTSGYNVIHPDDDDRHDYHHIYDVSGNTQALGSFINRLAKRGELVLAGFYDAPISFAFPPAFQREAKLRVAAEWQPEDLVMINSMVERGALNLSGLITHVEPASDALTAYPEAFDNSECLKMVLDWREYQ